MTKKADKEDTNEEDAKMKTFKQAKTRNMKTR